jgi:hypothetical protein
VELGEGLSLVRGDAFEGPHESSSLLCVLERDVPADDPIPADEAAESFADVVTAMRLWSPGGAVLGTPGWRQLDHARWQPLPIGSDSKPHGAEWMLSAGDEQAFREFFTAVSGADAPPHVSWALDRFEMGCGQPTDAEALSDYLLGLRALLDASTDAGRASFGLRLAALCAEEGARGEVRERLEATVALERFVMGGSGGMRLDVESPRELVAEVEAHLRALLRDVLCGYLSADLKTIADDILLEAHGDPVGEIEARDLRAEIAEAHVEQDAHAAPGPVRSEQGRFDRGPDTEPMTFEPELEWEAEPEYEYDDGYDYDYEEDGGADYQADPEYEAEVDSEPDTAELEAVVVTPEPVRDEPVHHEQGRHEQVQHQLDGVTQSADWGWDEPEDYSAPV